MVTILFRPLLIFVLQLTVPISVAAFVSRRVVDLGYAQYRSASLEPGITSFLGIRYAASPEGQSLSLSRLSVPIQFKSLSGPYRWTAPRKPGTIRGIQNATSQPPQCYQGNIGQGSTNPLVARRDLQATPTSEDCLFVNVHIPAKFYSPNLPVVVWIHGGGYTVGSNSQYPVQNLVTETHYGIIAVSIQYRLGIFGFLSGQHIKNRGVLNAGLLDQRFALQWVHDHIHCLVEIRQRLHFGGARPGRALFYSTLWLMGGIVSLRFFELLF
ncbi:hypothetical protein HGRIS_001106 [Hohenbuehelia grisea]|uniref:Carboxylesterase type B domain-containing protein n=1 Tax=Hohenbuehelia grisea TaxID=104357 RepID=A0ABR3JNU9_9AGAR